MSKAIIGNKIVTPTQWATDTMGETVTENVPVDGRVIAVGGWIGMDAPPKGLSVELRVGATVRGYSRGPETSGDVNRPRVQNAWTAGTAGGALYEQNVTDVNSGFGASQKGVVVRQGESLTADFYPGNWGDTPMRVSTMDSAGADPALYAVIEENRPPVIYDMNPGNDVITIDTTPDFTFTVHDDDRAEGYNDYPKTVIIRVWRNESGSYRFIDSQTFNLSAPAAGTADVPVTVTWSRPWTPLALGGKLKAWFNAGDISGISNGTALSQWDDSSGNNNHATQTTGANQPIYRTAQVNGLPAVEFDGANDYLVSNLSASEVDFSAIGVVKREGAGISQSIIGPNQDTGTLFRIGTGNTVQVSLATVGDYGTGTIVAPTSYAIVSGSLTASTVELGVNGTAESLAHSVAAPTAGRTSFLGARILSGIPAHFFDGFFAEMMSFHPSLATGERQQVEGYLAWKYNLVASLPAGHPYKTVAPTIFSVVPNAGADTLAAWTVEVRDEIGGETGTGYGGRDFATDGPDGTTEFTVSQGGYAVITSPSVEKIYNATPQTVQFTYTHPLGLSMNYFWVRLLKHFHNVDGDEGEYEEFQTTPQMGSLLTTYATGSTITVNWGDLGFDPLEYGSHYALEVMFQDVNGFRGGWTGRKHFHLNEPPQKAVISSPLNGSAVTSLPLVLFRVTDDDDSPAATWFNPNNYAIGTATYGTLGSGTAPNFNAPEQVAVDSTGRILVADTANNRLMVLTSAGAYSTSITGLSSITGVAVDALDYIYVSYFLTGTGRQLRKYNSSLVAQWTVTVDSATKLATDGTHIFASNPSNETITKFLCSTGAVVTSWGGPGTDDLQFNDPAGIAVSDLNSNRLFVADNLNYRIQVLDKTTGAFLFEWGGQGSDDGEFLSPTGVAVGPLTRDVYVADNVRGDVQVFSYDGEFLGKIGIPWATSTATGMLRNPMGIGIRQYLANESSLYVGDTWYNRITKFDILTPALVSSNNLTLTADVEVTGPLPVTNGTFDTNLTGWTYSEAGTLTETVTRETTSPHSGAGHLRILLSAGSPMAGNYVKEMKQDQLLPCAPGRTYNISAWYRRSAPGWYGAIVIQWGTESGGLIQEVIGPRFSPILLNTWTQISFSAQAPVNAKTFWYGVINHYDPNFAATFPVSLDWDDFTVSQGARYERPATSLGGGIFSYQMVANDMPQKDTYSVRVRGRDANSPGPWSDAIVFEYVTGPAATITNPASGAVVNVVNPLVEWFITAGTQWRYKVDILDAVTGVIVYSSDWIADPDTRAFRVPAGYLSTGGSYLARLWIDDGKIEVMV